MEDVQFEHPKFYSLELLVFLHFLSGLFSSTSISNMSLAFSKDQHLFLVLSLLGSLSISSLSLSAIFIFFSDMSLHFLFYDTHDCCYLIIQPLSYDISSSAIMEKFILVNSSSFHPTLSFLAQFPHPPMGQLTLTQSGCFPGSTYPKVRPPNLDSEVF